MKIWKIACIASFVTASFAGTIHADDEERRSTTEAYLGVLVPFNSLGGDLDGDRVYTNIDGTALVPDVDPGAGLGLVLGLKSNSTTGRAFAIEASLQGSRHDTEMAGGLEGEADFGLLSGDFKLFPATGGKVEPWVQIGLCVAALKLDDGFLVPGGSKDATYTGGGFNLGAGLLTYLSPRLALHLAGIYRFLEFDEVDYDRRAELDDELKAGTLSIELGLTLRFNRH